MTSNYCAPMCYSLGGGCRVVFEPAGLLFWDNYSARSSSCILPGQPSAPPPATRRPPGWWWRTSAPSASRIAPRWGLEAAWATSRRSSSPAGATVCSSPCRWPRIPTPSPTAAGCMRASARSSPPTRESSNSRPRRPRRPH